MDDQDFQDKLREAFRLETEERLRSLGTSLLRLEDLDGPAERKAELETVYREFHSLKGAAQAVGIEPVASLCQSAETALSDLRGNPERLVAGHIDALLAATAAVERIVISGSSPADGELAAIERHLRNPDAAPPAETQPQAPETAPAQDAVRIDAKRLKSLAAKGEEMALFQLADEERIRRLRELLAGLAPERGRQRGLAGELRAVERALAELPGSKAGDALHERVLRLGGLLERQHAILHQARERTAALLLEEMQGRQERAKQIEDFLHDVRTAVMLPFDTLLQPIPAQVRALARKQGKEIEVVLDGQDTEADRRLLDDLRDVVGHLVRNAVDHGIEPEAERLSRGKPPAGRLHIRVRHREDGRIELRIGDDGRGFDLERIRARAVAAGLVAEARAEELAAPELERLPFHSGFTTSPAVTDLSGRGLGLAIVRDRIERLGAQLHIDNRPGRGIDFAIVLPGAESTCRSILVRAGDRRFAVPAAAVRRVFRAAPEDLATVQGRPALDLGGRPLPVVELAAVLGLPARPRNTEGFPVLLLENEHGTAAYAVAAVEREATVLPKPLGPLLRRVPHVAAVAMLGDGELVPVLDPADLVRAAARTPDRTAEAAEPPPKEDPGTILVVEDSVTSRMLLKSILEAAGYRVRTAVDGVGGLAAVRAEAPDLVVSDVEMPRMNGFELTRAIRSEPAFARTPIVLVTSLASAEDRTKGLEAGADGYIVKSDFDQANLIETIGRLL